MARGGEQLVGDGVAAELLEEFVDSAIEGIDGGTEGALAGNLRFVADRGESVGHGAVTLTGSGARSAS